MTARRTWLGVCYEVCWAGTPYAHAGHYLGFVYADDDLSWATDAGLAEIGAALHTRVGWRRQITPFQSAGLCRRLADHRAGRGAKLLAVVTAAGIEFELVRLWHGTREGHEKYLKDLNDRVSLCPQCHPGTRAGLIIVPKQYRRKRHQCVLEAAA